MDETLVYRQTAGRRYVRRTAAPEHPGAGGRGG